MFGTWSLTAASIFLIPLASLNIPAIAKDAGSADAIDRTVLPIREPKISHCKIVDVRQAKAPPSFSVKAPAKAPNVLIVLIDDMGFGQSSAFGGPIHMPNLERMANGGLRYTDFHTTALCSPTRAALLSGRNHHTCNMGSITETATSFPGQTGKRPNSVAPLAEMLRLNGYSTAAFGKSHETAAWEVSTSGPTDRWPTRSGFDKFYGFIGGEANQWAPTLYDGLNQVEPPKEPDYHLVKDMTNQAVHWVESEKALTPDKPFFIYFAPGATHAPHHVPKEWIEKYKGKFDQGWDKVREETLERQKKIGMVPIDTKLAPKPEAIKDWDKLNDDEKKLFAHQMEVFAGYGEFADYEVGRLIKSIDDLGQLDNTLVFYIAGDNGASAEGGFNGLFNEMSYFNGAPESVADITKHYDELGGPKSYGHYAAGWAVAGDTPFTWTKQVASDYGGTKNAMAVHWPKGINAKGQTRLQFHHVIDIAPTILEAAGLPEPKTVNGTEQTPIEGVSMLYTFNDAKAKSQHGTQYFEIFGNRSIYRDGWLAGTVHRAPWEGKPRCTFKNDKWELYDTTKDFSLINDLAATNPKKLKEMQKQFLKEAIKYNVLPLDDRTLERVNAKMVGRPDLMAGRNSLTVYDGMSGMTENVFINTKNCSYSISAETQIPEGGANGVLISQAGAFGGWSFYLKEGKPTFTYNWLGEEKYTICSSRPAPSGKTTIRFNFDYDGGGPSKGGAGSIFVNGENFGQGRIEKTQGFLFSADEGADVGADYGTAVCNDYEVPNKFTGKIEKITVDVKPMGVQEKAEHDRLHKEGAMKKALSD
ncbi:MAG: arylsulfatase [Candidatus Melainabacteria bacterium]|nr:arylsulfatase [Candidatus Melainabacteria bacterium]